MVENQICIIFGTILGVILTLIATGVISDEVFLFISASVIILAVFVLPYVATKLEDWRMEK